MTVSLHPQAKLAFDAANVAFSSATGISGATIQLTSSKRDVLKQYELYVGYLRFKYFGSNEPFAPANRPGTSNHEYGLAIDITIGQPNEAEARNALVANGWVLHSNPKDPWHYDCSGISEWDNIQAKIRVVREAESQAFVDKIQTFLEAEKKVNDGWPNRTTMLQAVQSSEAELSQVQQSLEQASDEIKKLENSLERAKQNLEREEDRCERYRIRDVDGYEYTQCPDNNPLPQCTSEEHARFRNLYFREKSRREDRLRRWHAKIEREGAKIESMVRRKEQLVQELPSLSEAESRALERLSRVSSAYDTKAQQYENELNVISVFEENKAIWISDLQKVVDKVVAS